MHPLICTRLNKMWQRVMLLKKKTLNIEKRGLQLPLHLILVVPFFLQIVAAVGLTG
ncbi:MAG: hypothetical protein F6K35_49785 [Okeania sp. SIO2H7]|nr:hypothetical protein [Okeania sp. SIO2H7]